MGLPNLALFIGTQRPQPSAPVMRVLYITPAAASCTKRWFRMRGCEAWPEWSALVTVATLHASIGQLLLRGGIRLEVFKKVL